ncbi:MAG: hypothetical protein ACK4GO_02740 [Gemmobacter sp.]
MELAKGRGASSSCAAGASLLVATCFGRGLAEAEAAMRPRWEKPLPLVLRNTLSEAEPFYPAVLLA